MEKVSPKRNVEALRFGGYGACSARVRSIFWFCPIVWNVSVVSVSFLTLRLRCQTHWNGCGKVVCNCVCALASIVLCKVLQSSD